MYIVIAALFVIAVCIWSCGGPYNRKPRLGDVTRAAAVPGALRDSRPSVLGRKIGPAFASV